MNKQSHPFYRSGPWRKVRARALERDGGMCVKCMERFQRGEMRKPRRATMVHHIKSREEYPELALVLENLASSCDICHNQDHPEKGGQGAAKQEKRIPQKARERVIKM